MKEAIKEYLEICKLSGKWMKKHWKGYIVFCLLSRIITYKISFRMLFGSNENELELKETEVEK